MNSAYRAIYHETLFSFSIFNSPFRNSNNFKGKCVSSFFDYTVYQLTKKTLFIIYQMVGLVLKSPLRNYCALPTNDWTICRIYPAEISEPPGNFPCKPICSDEYILLTSRAVLACRLRDNEARFNTDN